MYYLVILGWKGNMSFSKFYGAYDFNTFYIDKCIKCEKEQLKYYNLWCEKYNKCFSKCTTDELGEWIIRYYTLGDVFFFQYLYRSRGTS